MSIEAWITLATVLALMAALASNRIGADTAILGALTFLMAVGVVDPARAVAGFADPAVLVIGALFVVASGLTDTGLLRGLTDRLLGKPKTVAGAQWRLMLPVVGMSAFLNNTPIVAMYLPVVRDYARRIGVSPSKLFMPLSFAAILGGACTLIGTSSNIIVNQLYLEHWDAGAGGELAAQFGIERPGAARQFWQVAAVGVPAAILGTTFIVLASRWLLPVRVPPDAAPGEHARRYTVRVTVAEDGPIVGRSIEAAGLRNLPGLYVSGIEREGRFLPAVGPETLLKSNDVLVLVGVVDSVVDLLKTRGLEAATDQTKKIDTTEGHRTVVEAVVSAGSDLVRRSVRDARFRTRYNAAIIAIHRGGQRLDGRIGDVRFQPGDTLLLETHANFASVFRNSPQFYLVSDVPDAAAPRHNRARVAAIILAMLVGLFTLPLGVDQTVAAFLCAVLMVFCRCTTGTNARRAINWQVLLSIAGALGIGRALQDTGAAAGVAHAVFEVASALGPHGLLAAFSLTAMLCTQFVTNQAAAVLMFPIGIALASEAGLNPEPFVITLMVSAACSFLTPVGYATNLMVFGPGGYRFADYARLGAPLSVLIVLITTVLAPALFPLGGIG